VLSAALAPNPAKIRTFLQEYSVCHTREGASADAPMTASVLPNQALEWARGKAGCFLGAAGAPVGHSAPRPQRVMERRG